MQNPTKFREIRLILGDQLNDRHSWFALIDPEICYVLMEIRPESEYVTHHIQKVVGIFWAMRNFAKRLRKKGHKVRYYQISDPDNLHGFAENLHEMVKQTGAIKLAYQEPDEYRLDQLLAQSLPQDGLEVEQVSSEHFLSERGELEAFFAGKKQYLMEFFYRDMRKKYQILMEGNQPVTGKWNYDHENRKKLPKGVEVPPPIAFSHDVSSLLHEIEESGIQTIGTIEQTRHILPANREEAWEVFQYFMEHLLPNFGKYQDALTEQSWSVFHSRISFALNLKMLHPLEIIRAVEARWLETSELASLPAVEGFIRQILGWREFVRGIYWAKMPAYRTLNFFDAKRDLPGYFWNGQTRMRCMSRAIGQSLQHGYAHHIQRLMVTGNFCALAGIDPAQVDAWYLGIYVDAFEWVEITNTRGMSQYADGGIIGSKPYVSSASYLHKMGDHCKSCEYSHKEKTGPNACPFNSLYWHFLDRNRDLLGKNPRMTMMYRLWDKMESPNQQALLEKAEDVLAHLEEL
ncbi:cryptochrome/photolyase family protein [Pontibacter sp. G13]|uniref:cryptochrome/photolyase family protein n=1 Tax=Pontibacter sp. G13 TaxID=3074898 RepID=UPI0028898E72|nr:cryptochrome/photolyase family protein [Pontibacter sp. G13]WNJ19938.1 cryptochrome/photolyase family protein [Pontibacter sp. G13]